MKTSIKILCISVSLIILQSCYVAKESSDFYGIQTNTKNTLYLIDISGSMEGIDEGSIKDQAMRVVGQTGGNIVSNAIGGKVGSLLGKQVSKQATKLGAVKRELIPAIKGFPDGKHFLIYAFENQVTKVSNEFNQANSTSRTTSSIFVQNLKASGGTNTLGGLVEALSTRDVEEIILMSDGLPNSSPEIILEEIRKINTDNVIIHTIAFGEDADHNFMRTLAYENNGTFVTSKI